MTRAKQLTFNLAAPVRIDGLSVTGGTFNITSALTTALSTAGDGSPPTAVPLQVASTRSKEGTIGVITATPNNYVKIFDGTTKNDITGTANAEVFARITEAGGVYTLTFYTLQAGVQTSHSFGSATTIDVLVNYRFDADRFPVDSLISTPIRNVSDDASASAVAKVFTEKLTPTALNTLPALTKTPDTIANLSLIINEMHYDSFDGASARFSLSGKTVTWDQTKGVPAFSITTSDRVIAQYTTLE